MSKDKHCFGDRQDGTLVRDADALHKFMPYILRNRADAEAFISENIDITAINNYLGQKNADNPEYKYTIFHVVCAALHKTLTLRPAMNRFIAGRRLYQRNYLSLAFVAKKIFSDTGGESLLMLRFPEEATINDIHDRIYTEVSKVRHGDVDNTTGIMDRLVKLPRWILRIVSLILRFLDYYGMVPQALIKEEPDYASVFISNLGSIKLNAGYHHLNNWGTNSLFVVIGEKHLSPVFDNTGHAQMRETVNIGFTLDERIADGYYYAKTIKLFKYLLQHPELLELPAREEVDYE